MKFVASRGFTLIELMITVAIIAILGAIAYPSYMEFVARSRRADARLALLENAQWLERQYTISGRYNKKGDSAATTIDSAQLPLKEAPRDSVGKSYDIAFAADEPTVSTYTLVATPKGRMLGDRCGKFTLTQSGVRGLVDAATGYTVAKCWEN